MRVFENFVDAYFQKYSASMRTVKNRRVYMALDNLVLSRGDIFSHLFECDLIQRDANFWV